MNIILIGFASCGKSVTAKTLGNKTGMRVLDLDRVIEEHYEKKHGQKKTCREIFKESGADGFSKLENSALQTLSDMRDTILSSGGRTPVYEENRSLLKTLGKIVYLKCDAKTVIDRMKNKGIPASMGGTEFGVMSEWKKREPIYSELADIAITNDNLSPDETAALILEKLNEG